MNTTGNTENEEFGPPKELYLNRSIRNECYVVSNRFESNPASSLKKQYEIDEDRISKTFSRLNFNVKVKQDLEINGIKKLLTNLQQKDHTGQECIALFILSHGSENQEIYGAQGRPYPIRDIVEKLQNIETLRYKPKLIFIQACRGLEEMKVHNVMASAGVQEIRVAEKANIFVYYATFEGTKCYASSKTGSFFIHALCGVLDEYYKNPDEKPKYHLGDVVTRVNEHLSTYVKDTNLKGENQTKALVQVSEACSSLTQHVYFSVEL